MAFLEHLSDDVLFIILNYASRHAPAEAIGR
jgi:hypothetical protein